MSTHKPAVHLLCGLTGSGKTSAARELVAQGCERLSVDQVIFERYGRQDEDFSSNDYPELHARVIAELDIRLRVLLQQRRDVVLDYGTEFWTRQGRDHYKQVAEHNGGTWTLIYLRADRELLISRLRDRNRRRDADAFRVTEARLDAFIAQFEEPDGEGEVIRAQAPSGRLDGRGA